MKQTAISLVIASALLAATPALAQQAAPNQAAQTRQAGSPSKLVLDNSTRILSTLESRRAEFTRDRAALSKFVSSEFNQMFDRDYAGRLVLGVHGRYGSSLLDFNTRLQVRVKSETPLRGGAIMRVSTEMLRQGGEPIPVDYLMRKTGNDWKVFDVMVEGVSFVQTFRNQFDSPLRQKSIPQVAAELKAGKLNASAN